MFSQGFGRPPTTNPAVLYFIFLVLLPVSLVLQRRRSRMFPPSQNVPLNLQALSEVTGSISIACWIVVFSPQIIQNFQRGSAEGLSIAFLVVWLAGDLFNIVGAVLQGVLPTMIILAAYYTLADIVLLFQCLYYRRLDREPGPEPEPSRHHHDHHIDGSHLSPTTPLLDTSLKDPKPLPPTPLWKSIIFNAIIVFSVCGAGAVGWWLSRLQYPRHSADNNPPHRGDLEFSPLGQLFGYLCALFYLASRIPQILLNYRRQSCDGVSILFFLFAGIGNLTYVMSILTYDGGGDYDGSGWDREKYTKYIAVNASWLLGSVGTLVLDTAIFVQFFMYCGDNPSLEEDADEGEGESNRLV